MFDYSDFIRSKLAEVARHLGAKGYRPITKRELPNSSLIEGWKGNITWKGKTLVIIVGIPSGFPDELPKIYLAKNPPHPCPHIDENKFICTYDTVTTDIISEEYTQIIDFSIERARRIMGHGLEKSNQDDFDEEFLAYWESSNNAVIYTLFTVDSLTKPITIIFGPNFDHNIEYIAVDNNTKIELVGSKYFDNYSTLNALYVPLSQPLRPNFPRRAITLYKNLSLIDKQKAQAIRKFIEKDNNPSTIFISVPINGSLALAALYCIPKIIVRKGKYHGYKTASNDKTTTSKSFTVVNRVTARRLDTERIQKRTGQTSMLKNKSVCIVGAGAIGSMIAFHLARSGVTRIHIIDDDKLSAGNIGRHWLGSQCINKFKSESMAYNLNRHFADLEATYSTYNLHEFCSQNFEEILSYDILISATGNTTTDRRINYLQVNTSAFPAVLYSWIEPYGMAGHSLLIHDHTDYCYDCCHSSDLTYKYRAFDYGEGLTHLKEAGCQTSFSPYTGLDADRVAISSTKVAIGHITGKITSNTAILSTGDISSSLTSKRTENPIHETIRENSELIYNPKKSSSCRTCK